MFIFIILLDILLSVPSVSLVWIKVYLGVETNPIQWWLWAIPVTGGLLECVEFRRGMGEVMGGGGWGKACLTIFSSWSWGVKLCVDVCMSWLLIRGWDAAAPDPYGRTAGWDYTDPTTLMALTPTSPTRRLMSTSEPMVVQYLVRLEAEAQTDDNAFCGQIRWPGWGWDWRISC